MGYGLDRRPKSNRMLDVTWSTRPAPAPNPDTSLWLCRGLRDELLGNYEKWVKHILGERTKGLRLEDPLEDTFQVWALTLTPTPAQPQAYPQPQHSSQPL